MSVERLELRFKDAASVQKVLHARMNLSDTRNQPPPFAPPDDIVPVKNYVYRRFIERRFIQDISALTFPIIGCKCRRDFINESYTYVCVKRKSIRSDLSESAQRLDLLQIADNKFSIKVKTEKILGYLI